jgi:hypothetical protein
MASDIIVQCSVANEARKCVAAFVRLTSPSAETEHELQIAKQDREMLSEQVARFKVWAGNIGVFAHGQAAVDYRLRNDPDISEIFVKLLQRISEALQDSSTIENPDEMSEQSSSESEYSSDSSLGLSASEKDSNSEEQSSVSTEHETVTVNKHIEVIAETITHLYKVTAIIRKPVSSDKEGSRIQAWFDKQEADVDEDLHDMESYIRWSIDRKWHRLKESADLVERLVRTSIDRRKRLLYRKDHRLKLQKGVDDVFVPSKPERDLSLRGAIEELDQGPHPQPPRHVEASKSEGKAVTFFETRASTVQRRGLSTYTKSVILSSVSPSVHKDLESLDVPPPPNMESGCTEVICPYCSLPLNEKVVGNGRIAQWK